jgi:hypothetical protein
MGGIALARFIVSSLALSACVASGAPHVRADGADGEGTLIEGCRNVSAHSRIESYDTRFYHTTYGSAWVEGSTNLATLGEGRVAQAIQEAMGEARAQDGRIYYALPFNLRAYCRAYDADRALVARIVAGVVARLGNPVERADISAGVFRTGRIERSHAMAAWQDSYAIAVYTLAPGRTAVWIQRKVYISRGGGPFDEGISSGRNETWIFTEIGDRLDGRVS